MGDTIPPSCQGKTADRRGEVLARGRIDAFSLRSARGFEPVIEAYSIALASFLKDQKQAAA